MVAFLDVLAQDLVHLVVEELEGVFGQFVVLWVWRLTFELFHQVLKHVVQQRSDLNIINLLFLHTFLAKLKNLPHVRLDVLPKRIQRVINSLDCH